MTQSAIDDTREVFAPDGVVVAFAYSTPFLLKTDLTVTLRTIATGVDVTLVLTTDYTIAATNDDYTSGATITTVATYTSTSRLIIERDEPFSQTVDLTEAQKIPAKTLEDGLDRQARLSQQLLTRDLRTLRFPVGDLSANVLPNSVDRASKILSFDSAGQPVAATLVAGTPEVDFDLTYGKEFWIDDEGADKTGVLDSQPAFVLAEAKAAVAGGTVRIGVGKYGMLGECLVSDGVKVRGSGRMDQTGTDTILGTDVFALDSFVGTRMFAQKNVGTNEKGLAFEDMTVRGDKPGGGNINIGIEWKLGKYWTFKNLAIQFFQLQGIYVSHTGSGVGHFENIVIRDVVQGTSLAAETGALEIHSQDNSFFNIEATTSSTDLDEAGKRIALLLGASSAENFIFGGQFEASEVGIVVRGVGGNKFLGTRSDLNFTDGWQIRVGGNTLSGCESLSNGQKTDDTYTGFHLFAQNNLLVACLDRSQQSNKIKYGFRDASGAVGNKAVACKSTDFQTAERFEDSETNFWDHDKLLIPNPAQTKNYIITPAAIVADRALSLPLLTAPDTLAVLGFAQTWSAGQTFAEDKMLLANPAATFSYVFSPAAIAGNRVIELPLMAGNDTMVLLGQTQTLTAKVFNTANNTLTIGQELDLAAFSIGGTAQAVTGDGSDTIDWGLGNVFNFQFGAANETFVFTAPTKPGLFYLKLVQDSVGSRTVTWPATVKWAAATAPTLTTTATTGTDLVTFYYDGAEYNEVSRTLNI